FSVGQVKELKKVLSKGFANGESIREIKNSIRRNVKPKDLLKMEDGKIVKKDGVGVVVKSAKNRDLLIARTEVTRMANEGALRHYKKGGIKRVKFVASFGARTCPICEDLDGGVYKIGEGPVIPVHPMCRCTWVPVTELS
ncbi:MAG: minor capsid protein, partial [Candidatus Heimdallarchaeaceae archaeon]